MFVQTEVTPNPNSLKFLPGKKVSNSGPYEITNKEDMKNELVRNILSINGVVGIFLGQDFISVNKNEKIQWDEIKHIVISLINDFYADGKEFVIDENIKEEVSDLNEIEEKIVKILDQKIRPAVARDGGDIKFKEFKDGIVKVHINKYSIYNTPPVFPVYVSLLNMKWLKNNGGIKTIEEINTKKANLLYSEIDINPLFKGHAKEVDRSIMNVTFNLVNDDFKETFNSMISNAGIIGINGHRSIGGYRASMYNALPIESVKFYGQFLKTLLLEHIPLLLVIQ